MIQESPLPLENKVAIVIITYNNANLISKQVECVKRFCKDDLYDIIIVDNSNNSDVIKAILYYNQSLGCRYHKTLSDSPSGTESHCFAANNAYGKFDKEYSYFLFLDHDNFPIKDFSVKQILENKIIGGLGQAGAGKGKKYFWAGCVMFDNSKIEQGLIDFSYNHEWGLDTGGNLYRVVEKYGEDNCIFFNEAYCQNPYFTKNRYDYYALINDGMFMHFVNSSNWAKTSDHEERINSLLNILEEKIK